MKLDAPVRLHALTVLILLGFAMTADAQATLTGTATYRERMALPNNALFEATLESVARADAAAEILGRARIEGPPAPPIKFSIAYDPARVTPQGRYAVRARITVDGKPMFVSDTHTPAFGAQAKPVELLLRRPASALQNLPASFVGDLPCADCTALRHHLILDSEGGYILSRTYVGKSDKPVRESGLWTSADGRIELARGSERTFLEIRDQNTLRFLDKQGPPIASQHNYEIKRTGTFEPLPSNPLLENIYWKLTRLGNTPAIVFDNQPESHFLLQSDKRRVAGSGSCNRFTGAYELDGEGIRFSGIARTLMACPQGHDQEQKFHDVLGAAKRWRITGKNLELLDDFGAAIATFERQVMR